MSRIEQKGFFLIETLIVTTIVSMAMIFLYTQMTQLLSSYELRLTYNTVEGMYAAANMNDYILADGKYDTITTDLAIASNGFLDFDCTTFSSAEYCNVLKAEMNIEKMIITTYNTADIKAAAPTEISFSDGLKLFISNIKNEDSAGANEFRLIIEFSDKTFATSKLTDGDKTAPVITGNANFYYRAGTTIDATDGLVATDNIYGDISDNIVCTFVAGSTYNCVVKDSNGNTSDTFVRTAVEGEEVIIPDSSLYTYQRALVIDNTKIDSALANFPVTVILDNTNFDFTHLKATGTDIKFVDNNGDILSFEREYYNATNEKAVFHVKLPSVSSSSDTTFYIQYDYASAPDLSSPASVWDSNYVMVQHMDDSLLDSTSNNHDGVNHSTTAVDSSLGRGRSGGGTSYIDFGFKAAAGTLTVSQVFNANSGDRYTLSDSGDAGYLLHQLLADGTGFQVYIGDNYVSPNQFPTTVLNTYHYSYITSDGTNNYFSVNNAAPSTNALGFAGNVGNLYGLNNGALDRGFSGVVDEIRISNIKRSDAWLKAEYNSLLDTLLTYGTETNI